MKRALTFGFGTRAPAAPRPVPPAEAAPAAARRTSPEPHRGDPAEALRLMRSYEDSCQGWFWSTDAEGKLTYISDSIARALIDDPALLFGARFADLFERADEDTTGRRTLPFLMAKQSGFEKITVRAAGGGDPRCWSVSGAPQYDGAARFAGYRGAAVDVTEQLRTSEHASQLAKYDSLTALPNRRRMSEVLDAFLAGAEHRARPCAVMLIDLDRFKQVNDTLGHPAGDALLKQVGERLSRIVGDKEKAFRLGGDEFQIILPNVEDRGVIGEMAAEIIAVLSQPYFVEGSRCIIGASVGVAVAPADGSSRVELIRNADLALYASKSGGRGRFRFFSSDLLQVAEDKRTLEEDLRDALARGEIGLAYQPIVNAATNHVTGVEALIRWEHPLRGPISPALFIPIAEEAGLIAQFGEWALRKACEDAAGWPGRLRVAVNVSPLQFAGEALPALVLSALAASGLAPDRLELEITEGVFLGESTATDTMFAALKEIGVRLALDDFGTGYSSLGYLRTAPFDKIKIDQTFVRDATLPESRNGAIIAAIVALAEALGMETTAEGIEYMDQLQLIRSLRVSHVQGWVYSKALGSEELSRRLQAGDLVLAPSGPARERSGRQATYRKVGIVHANRYTSVIMRNLSESGALIDGVGDLPLGAQILVDFGDGQLTFARVTRAAGRQLGIAFEQELVDDGNGGLCTSHRVSPYLLSMAGLPTPGGEDRVLGDGDGPAALDALAGRLGLARAPRPAPPAVAAQCAAPTFRDLAGLYLDSVADDEQTRAAAESDLIGHILPRFGPLRIDQVGEPDVAAWLAARTGAEGLPPGADSRLRALLGRMWSLALERGLPGAPANPLAPGLGRRGGGECTLTLLEAEKLLDAASESQNRQLRYILALLMLTGARPRELLHARWEHIDLAAGLWRVAVPGAAKPRPLRLGAGAVRLLEELPRAPGCPYLVANPITGRPYQSLSRSWDVARSKAGLPYLEIEDLRYCDLGSSVWEDRLLAIVRDPAPEPESRPETPCPGAEPPPPPPPPPASA